MGVIADGVPRLGFSRLSTVAAALFARIGYYIWADPKAGLCYCASRSRRMNASILV